MCFVEQNGQSKSREQEQSTVSFMFWNRSFSRSRFWAAQWNKLHVKVVKAGAAHVREAHCAIPFFNNLQ